MKSIFACLIILLLFSCSQEKHLSHFDYYKSETPWIDAFKDQAFFSCLKESHPEDTLWKILESRDLFNPYDGLDLKNLKIAQKLGDSIARNIPTATYCEGCKSYQNYYIATCLHYYKSRELDSIAQIEYKRFKLEQKKDYY